MFPHMALKTTEPLAVIGDYTFSEGRLGIHPNDGFDLGLMTTEYTVDIFTGEAGAEDFPADQSPTAGTIYLKNECRAGTVEMSLKTADRLSNPKKVRLAHEDGKILILPA